MEPMKDCEVLVSGAGPVGMTVAAYLAHHGIRVQIVEQAFRPAARSYALALHPASLALFSELGITRHLIALGKIVDKIALYEDDVCREELHVADLIADFPFILVLPQSALEDVLSTYLRSQAVPVLWNHRVARLATGPGMAEVEIERLAEESAGYGLLRARSSLAKPVTVRAFHVVGADGYRSAVRHALGIEFPDLGGSQTFGVFELDAAWNPGQEMRVILTRETTNVLWPLGENRFRFSFELSEPEWGSPRLKRRLLMQMGEEAFPYIAQDLLEDLVRERAPWFDGKIRDVAWSVAVTFERRLAESFGRENAWLAGDAAHLGLPVGVHSMNVGLREAVDVAERITKIQRDGAPRDLLDTYGEERLAEWRRLLALNGVPEAGEGAKSFVRENVARLIPTLPASGEELEQLLAQIGVTF